MLCVPTVEHLVRHAYSRGTCWVDAWRFQRHPWLKSRTSIQIISSDIRTAGVYFVHLLRPSSRTYLLQGYAAYTYFDYLVLHRLPTAGISCYIYSDHLFGQHTTRVCCIHLLRPSSRTYLLQENGVHIYSVHLVGNTYYTSTVRTYTLTICSVIPTTEICCVHILRPSGLTYILQGFVVYTYSTTWFT